MTREAYERGRIVSASQDGSREFISLLACICADGTAIPPALIYQGTSGDTQDTWLEDFDHSSGNSRRLLLADGHSSHVNLRFINYCDENRIVLVVLPPHLTHRLQPLNVGIFSPLAHAYLQEIN